MIESIYNIKPKDIIASIALEKAEGKPVSDMTKKAKEAASTPRSPRSPPYTGFQNQEAPINFTA